MVSAKNFVLKPVLENNHKLIVWFNLGGNVLFSFPFMLFKLTNIAAINFSIIIGILSILLFFYFVYLFYNEKIALWAALFMAVSQPFIINSISTYNHGMALFPVFLSLIFFGLFIKSNNLKFNFTSLLILTFAISIRIEYILILAMYISYYVFVFIKKREGKTNKYFKKLYNSLIGISIFLIPFFYSIYELIKKDIFLIGINLQETRHLAVKYFLENIINLDLYTEAFSFINFFEFAFILKISFLILLLVGLVYSFLKNKYLTIYVLSYFIIFHLFFSFVSNLESKYILSTISIFFIFLACSFFFVICYLIDFIKIKFLNLFIKSFLIIAVACFILYPIIALPMSRSSLGIGQQKLILQTRLPSYISNFYSNEINNCTFVSALSELYYASSYYDIFLEVNEFKTKLSEINLSLDCFIFIKDKICIDHDESYKCDYMFENFLMEKDNDFYLDDSKDVFFTTYRVRGLKKS